MTRAALCTSILGCVLAVAGCGSGASEGWVAEPGTPRNLLLITIDTLRADHVGAYGYERDTTPGLDRLAAGGTVFRSVVAQSNWTVPATATILTSVLPSRHGAEVGGEVKNLSEGPLHQIAPGVPTLADVLRDHGFRTGLFSANPYLFGRFQSGFDVARVGDVPATQLVDDTLRWLAASPGDQPFFAYLQLMDLHNPIDPPEPHASTFAEPGDAQIPALADWRYGYADELANRGEDFERYRRAKIARYDGALRFVDAEIGRLLDALRDAGRLEGTLVVVTSDHGEEFWENVEQELALGGDPRGIYGLGHGHSMFRELLDAILVVWGPSIRAGVVADCSVRQLEIAPTVLDLLGVAPPETMSGVSLGSAMRTGNEGWSCPDLPIVSESPAYGPDMAAVQWRGRKLVKRADGRSMLFDLRRDPDEEVDLAAERPDDVVFLTRLLEATVGGEGPATEAVEIDPETEAQLRTLGYLN